MMCVRRNLTLSRPLSQGKGAILSRRSTKLGSYVEASVVVAVTQQAVAFAGVLGAEALYTRSQLFESNKGRPELVPVAAGAVSSLSAAALIQVTPLVTFGMIAGLIGSGAMMYYNFQRIQLTTEEDIAPDWPGPKVWPVGMTLISFFALNVFLQGLKAEI